MPGTPADILDTIQFFAADKAGAVAVLELVHSMPKQGLASTWKFGVNYGELRMALTATKIPFKEVTPQKWQREFGLPTLRQCGGSKPAKKNKHKERAQQLFPDLKITHAVADALLLAEFCRRTWK
jgi:crossover junction endodeoxyribonuclease RuvC